MLIRQKYSKRHGKSVWRFDVRINKKRYRDSGFATKQEAQLAVAALRLSARESKYGISPLPKPTTVRTLVAADAQRLQRQMIVRRGEQYAKRNVGYLNRLRRWGQYVGFDRPVSSINEEDLLSWLKSELERGLQKSSVLRGLNTIRAALRQGTRNYPDLYNYRVPGLPKGLATCAERTRVLEADEIRRLSEVLGSVAPKTWRHEESWRDAGAFFLIALATGCRIGDVLNLKWEDVNMHVQTLRVSMQKNNGAPLLLQLGRTVEDLILRRRQEGLGSSTHVFTSRDHSIRKAMQKASEIVGITYGQQVAGGWTVHDLRATYLTYLLQAGTDAATVRDLAGHSSIAVTNSYLRSTRDSRKKASLAAETLVSLASGLISQ